MTPSTLCQRYYIAGLLARLIGRDFCQWEDCYQQRECHHRHWRPPSRRLTPRVYGPSMTRSLAPKMSVLSPGPERLRVVLLIDRLIDALPVPCDFNTSVSIIFSGKEFQISPSHFNLVGPKSSDSSTCVGGFGAIGGLGEHLPLLFFIEIMDSSIMGRWRHVPAQCIHDVRFRQQPCWLRISCINRILTRSYHHIPSVR